MDQTIITILYEPGFESKMYDVPFIMFYAIRDSHRNPLYVDVKSPSKLI